MEVKAQGFTVCAKRCDECLFTPDRIVDGERMAEVLRTCSQNNTYFVCHKFSVDADAEAPYTPQAVCCRGFYDTHTSKQIQMARALGIVVFVDEAGNEIK